MPKGRGNGVRIPHRVWILTLKYPFLASPPHKYNISLRSKMLFFKCLWIWHYTL